MQMDLSRVFDLLVLGGGNAALCAAITARRAGLTVLRAESAPIPSRGGNSRHTRNMRTMHMAPIDVLTDTYPEEEYWDDLVKVTGGLTDEKLARMAIRHPQQHVPWMRQHGVRFHAPLGGPLQPPRTNPVFLRRGKAPVEPDHPAAGAPR